MAVTQYVANLGMEMNYQFHDVFGLDPDLLAIIPQPCLSLLLLFPINEKVELGVAGCTTLKFFGVYYWVLCLVYPV